MRRELDTGMLSDLSHGGAVVIGDMSHPEAWSISMDQFIVDVDVDVGVGVGDGAVTLADEVVLLGSPATSEPDSRYWGAVTGTIAHEILTGLGGRMATCQTNQTQGTNP